MAESNGHKPGLLQRALAPTIAAEIDARQEQLASELIGRHVHGDAQVNVFRSRARVKNIDQTIPDYEFYDKLRRGKAKGYSLGGLFSTRIEKIFASWVLGRGVEIALQESGDPDNEEDPRNYTDGRIADFLNDNHALLMQTLRDALGLGDQYVIVNMDGSLSVPSPDTVEVERSEVDYREVLAVQVVTKLDKVTITDRYTAESRTVTIKEGANGRETSMTFDNLIGRIPVVHIAHGRSANETNGHPIHETLLPLYDQYDDLIYKQLDGAKLLGNPLLAFVGMEDINEVMNANKPATAETYQGIDGGEATRDQLNIDQNAVLLVGKGGDAKFVSPPVGFTEDTKNTLKALFLLLMDHTGIPEFVWGNELSSARASSDTQMTQFVRDVEGQQRDNETWLLDLAAIWLLVAALVDGRIVADDLAANWPPLIEEDDEIQLKKIELARRENVLTDKTALALLNLVDDPGKEVEEAQAEAKKRREEMFPDGSTMDFQRQLMPQGDEGE